MKHISKKCNKPLFIILFTTLTLLIVAHLLQFIAAYEFALYAAIGIFTGFLKNTKYQIILFGFVFLSLPVSIFGDPLIAPIADKLFPIPTVNTLIVSFLLNWFTRSAFFISYSVTRLLIKLKVLEEYW